MINRNWGKNAKLHKVVNNSKFKKLSVDISCKLTLLLMSDFPGSVVTVPNMVG